MATSPACDRCYAIKARCIAGVPGGACYRCYRLHHSCTYSRKRERPGRKRKRDVGTPSVSNSSPPSVPIHDDKHAAIQPQRVPSLSYQRPSSPQVSQEDVLQVCRFFSMGMTLSLEMRRLLYSRLREAPLLLMEPFTAVARVFLRARMHRDSRDEIDLSRCASALQSLRKMQVCKAEEVGSCLALGLSLMTFQRLISSASASTICRYTLSLVEPWYATVWKDPSISMELTCLVLLDTMHSLFRRRIPVLQYRVRDPYMIDRNIGVCGSLLPLLYSLCLLAAAVRVGGDHAPQACHFDQLQRQFESWVPYIPSDILQTYPETDILLLMTQAHLNRAAALLTLHRLRYPFEEKNEEASLLSKSMTTDLANCQAEAGRLPPNILFPLLMAGAEAVDVDQRRQIRSLITGMNGVVAYPFISNLQDLLSGIWSSRNETSGQFLFDLFDRYPDVSILL